MSPGRESRQPRGTTPRSTSLGPVVGAARLKDEYPKPLRTVAGVCMISDALSRQTRATALLMSFESLSILAQATITRKWLGPAADDVDTGVLQSAVDALETRPDLVLVAGHGVADVGRDGLAVRLGVEMDIATIGVALDSEVGTSKPLHEMRGAFSPLREDGIQIGWVLRSKINAAPVVVSPGHRVSMAAAPELVMDLVRDASLPEPIRIANLLVQAR